MKIFLVQWTGKEFGLVGAAEEIKRRGHEITYWVGADLDQGIRGEDFPGTIFHGHFDAMKGIAAAGVDESGFLPPSADFISQMLETEATTLAMMNKQYGDWSLSKRKHFYYHLLRYWSGVLDKYKPDVVIFPMEPHVPHEFVIYSLARHFGIKTLMFRATEVSDRMIVMEDFTVGGIYLKKLTEENKNKTFSFDSLDDDLKEFYKKITENKYVMPLSLRVVKAKYGGKNLIREKLKVIARNFRSLNIFQVLFNYIKRQFTGNLRKEYERVQQEPDFNKKFIYFSFHYQPEATSCPLGGFFVDQCFAVEVLSAALPKDWVIYVKEHPSQWLRQSTAFSGHRYKGFYEGLAKIKNVRVVPINTPTYELTEKAQAVATITGTVGLEAIFKSKPALVFGYPWYKYCPGVFSVKGVDSCKEALEAIEKGFRIQKEQVVNFLANLGRASIHGFLEAHTKQLSKISAEKNAANIAAALLKEIEG